MFLDLRDKKASMPKPRLPASAAARSGAWLTQFYATGRLSEIMRESEHAGMVFAFRARLLAIMVVSIWLLALVPWPRNVYYVMLAAVFFALGYVPYLLSRHRFAEAFKIVFIVLDVVLITAAILAPPPGHFAIEWPIQTRLRGQVFLFLLLLLGEAALTYSPRRVLITGAAILLVWTFGYEIIQNLPDTLSYYDVMQTAGLTDADRLRMYVDPRYVKSRKLERAGCRDGLVHNPDHARGPAQSLALA